MDKKINLLTSHFSTSLQVSPSILSESHIWKAILSSSISSGGISIPCTTQPTDDNATLHVLDDLASAYNAGRDNTDTVETEY